jgi:hypothetical protein
LSIPCYLRLLERRGLGELEADFLVLVTVRDESCLADFSEADLGAERRVRCPPPEGGLRPLGIGSALISGLTLKPDTTSLGKRW